jgi:aminoglycoside phosphotransferase (APT) family kinase protein
VTSHFLKRYPNEQDRRKAERNYRWLASLQCPLVVPELCVTTRLGLYFEYVDGRHARPDDLTTLAAHLGEVHQAAYLRELHAGRLGSRFRTASGHLIPGFPHGRVEAVTRELRAGHAPGAALTIGQAQVMLTSADGPPAFYKDANPRNFLITSAGPVVTVDFDDLTLAPFGYDLAKLIVALAMTHGPLPAPLIAGALAAYNHTIASHGLAGHDVTWSELMGWAEIHFILTSRYAAADRYPCQWSEVRPTEPPSGACT